jgi:hypothetical protein
MPQMEVKCLDGKTFIFLEKKSDQSSFFFNRKKGLKSMKRTAEANIKN